MWKIGRRKQELRVRGVEELLSRTFLSNLTFLVRGRGTALPDPSAIPILPSNKLKYGDALKRLDSHS